MRVHTGFTTRSQLVCTARYSVATSSLLVHTVRKTLQHFVTLCNTSWQFVTIRDNSWQFVTHVFTRGLLDSKWVPRGHLREFCALRISECVSYRSLGGGQWEGSIWEPRIFDESEASISTLAPTVWNLLCDTLTATLSHQYCHSVSTMYIWKI